MTTASTNWFDVDRKGLAKLIERRGGPGGGKAALVCELIANACDAEGTTTVAVSFTPEPGEPKVWISVVDDAPDGFADLRHAWTLFAESQRKADAMKRGRFNLGEKLVLSLCDEATITTTTGSVMFDQRGRTSKPRTKRERGSEFIGLARMTRAELDEVRAELRKIIPPHGVRISINGIEIPPRAPLAVLVEATLPTEIADDEGMLRRTRRACAVRIYEPFPGEIPMLYELGIPVVETNDRWHVDVQQKVPLNMDRDNVTPAYLREIRTLVVNQLHAKLTEADAGTPLVREALADPDASSEAVYRALDLQYGEKRAVWDPSDMEANMRLVSEGYSLIKGGQLSGAQWKNVRKHGAALPAGQIAPTKVATFTADGEDVWVPREKWTLAMSKVADFSERLGALLLGATVRASILCDIRLSYAACFGASGLVFNLGKLGHKFFRDCMVNAPMAAEFVFRPSDALLELLVHEFAHHYEANHLSDKYHDALCTLAVKLARLALEQPELFMDVSEGRTP